MTNYYLNFLDQASKTQKKSVQKYELHGEQVWLKKASKRHSTWIYLPLGWVSKLLGLHMLAPVPNYGSNKAISCEIQRLQELQELGIRVPTLLAQRQDCFLIQDAAQNKGQSVQLGSALKKQPNTESRLTLYAKAVQAIHDIHSRNAYLSEAFARNMLIDDQQNLTFIDFETDPAHVLSLEECQSRDWLCFIFSTADYFNDDELLQASYLLSLILSEHPQSFSDVSRVAQKAQWIAKLKPEKLGHDGVRLVKCIQLLQHIHTQYIYRQQLDTESEKSWS